MKFPYRYAWKNNAVRAQFYNKFCRVISRGKMNTVLIEFVNGFRTSTSGNALRKRKP